MELVEFEYKIIEYLGIVSEENFLNEVGMRGWELCHKEGNKFYFKRVKPSTVLCKKKNVNTLYAHATA